MYCTGCGNDLRDIDRFCPMCGHATHGQAAGRTATPGGYPKRLVRPMLEKSVGGVCAGFAQYLGIDVTVTRIVWLLVAIFTGAGFIAYLVCWIVMPADWGPAPASAQATAQQPPPEAPPASEPATESG
ncbi:MAG: PspC domain-containing protein [bacterium]|nr:PspC domain-containing protein [bacterium]